jgi:hypothetical protein
LGIGQYQLAQREYEPQTGIDDMTIPEIIDRIEAGKIAARIFPIHATLIEIAGIHGNTDEVKAELNRLRTEGKIEAGHTLNGRYVHVAGRNYNNR